MRLHDKLISLRQEKKGILAANFYNFETLYGIIDAAAAENKAIILQLAESSIHYMGLSVAAKLARTALQDRGVTGWLHLDHGSSVEMVKKCLDAGFDSVMIDASEKDLATNIKFSKKVVKLAHPYLANVEAELGYHDEEQEKSGNGFTQPEFARNFVNETGIHSLAVAIGAAHGHYKKAPKLDLALIAEISEATRVPLVLHGSSSISEQDLQAAIRSGITKVNVSSSIRKTFLNSLQHKLKDDPDAELGIVFGQATQAVNHLIRKQIHLIYSA